MKIDLDIYELSWLLDACLRGSHLRSSTLERFVDEWFEKLTEQQRYNLYEWSLRLTYNGHFKPCDCCCGADIVFMKRYDPENQYIVTTKYDSEIKQHRAFFYNGEYHVKTNIIIAKEYIVDVYKYVPHVQRTDYELKIKGQQ